MKLIIYLLKKVLPLFFGAMFFFALVLNLVDLFMNIANYLQNNCAAKDILMVMAYYVPKTIWYAVPVAILFSTSYALSEMYAANEIQALLASGVSLFRFTLPLLVISLAMAYGLFVFENKFVVQTYEKKTTMQETLLQKKKNENNTNVIVLSDNGRIIYSAARYLESQKKLRTCYFVFRGEERELLAIIYSKQAVWNTERQVWELEEPVQYEPVEDTLKVTNVNYDYVNSLTESYEIFRKTNVDVQSVSAEEAKLYIQHLKKAGLPYNEELSEYYKKFAFPFIVFIVVFLSIGLTGKTRKNVLLISLASCIGASVLFYVTMMVTMVLAKHGYISAFAGAWSPVIFFTVISVVLLRFART
ncbi:lipopolysaccharide export system permease protein [Treponema bryantii]|uniref:Lipopolysaccharide export system permease protein n=1 Tax=Treponema bryantii TaxID=163 RepID=A0A1I3K304_9SPIR|nr:LptF/LptG family permease [Treponema bryantii]SFI66806.1 lipopolysaccharide export system permease protein [Treponema bryantii]